MILANSVSCKPALVRGSNAFRSIEMARVHHDSRRRGCCVAARGARAAGRMFADIWDYSDVKGEAVPSFAILTDEPNELGAPYHDRMPVVLGDLERWLNLDTTLDDVDPLEPERSAVRAVKPAINKVSEKNIDAIERAA
jgi:putative SOS response-associated peptidase YedK